MWTLLHRRDDGSFVIKLNGHPYHVTQSDPLFADVSAAPEGVDLSPEPVPEPVPPPPAPIVLTNRQLFAALALTGFITEAEALAAGRAGAVPIAIDSVFAELPAQDAFLARLTWATMREVARDHPLIGTMIMANLATEEQVDAIFTLGASIP
jgi:hypothetical protein